MSKLYQVKQKQLQDANNRLEKLEEDYKANSEELDYTDDQTKRNRLKRKQQALEKDMDELAKKHDQLEEELQKIQTEKQVDISSEVTHTLIVLLIPINFEVITKIYRDCLTESRPRVFPATLEALVRQLAEIPGEPKEAKPLLRFVSLLIQEPSITAEQRESLRIWATKQGMIFQEDKVKSLERAEVCLMIKVQPRALNDPSLGYVIEAAIAQDPDSWNCQVELLTTPLSIAVPPDPKCAPGYSQDDLPKVLDALVATCGSEHHLPLTELVIQWFLPNELMSLPIEHWQLQTGRHQKDYCGSRCKAVIIRSSDRHFLPHYQSASGDWKKYWIRLLDCHGSKCSEVLVQLNPGAGKTKVNWKNARVVGCKFVEHPDPQQQERLWDELLSQGVPVVLWIRQTGAQGKKPSLSTCTIANLSEALTTHRQRALSHDSEADRLRAASVCLLLDNPFRPFPTLDYESA